MKDLNFFSSYSKKRDRRLNRQKVFYMALSLIVLALLVYGIFNYIVIRRLNGDINASVERLEELNGDSKIKELKQKQTEIAAFKENIAKVKTLDDYINNKDIINDFLLDDIESNLPPKVFLRSMDLKHDAIKITGTSQDKESIAQFEHNLKEMGVFEELFIPQITQREDYLDFTIDIEFKKEEEKKDGA